MTYYYEFTLDGNIIGYTQPFHKDLLPDLNKTRYKSEALLQFCDKYSLNCMDVEVEIAAMRSDRADKTLEFDFKYNGR